MMTTHVLKKNFSFAYYTVWLRGASSLDERNKTIEGPTESAARCAVTRRAPAVRIGRRYNLIVRRTSIQVGDLHFRSIKEEIMRTIR